MCADDRQGDSSHNRGAAEGHYYSALDLFGEGKHEEAIRAYLDALAVDPTFTDAMHGLARVYQEVGHFDEAIAVSAKIVQLDPDDILAHTSLYILFQRKGMVPEAEAEANKARVLGWKQQLREQKQKSG